MQSRLDCSKQMVTSGEQMARNKSDGLSRRKRKKKRLFPSFVCFSRLVTEEKQRPKNKQLLFFGVLAQGPPSALTTTKSQENQHKEYSERQPVTLIIPDCGKRDFRTDKSLDDSVKVLERSRKNLGTFFQTERRGE